ncbi:MAG: hypothetical protein R6V76_13140 [Desulfobacterales bacterium]
MNILIENEFRDIVKAFFKQKQICFKNVQNSDRRDSTLDKELFFNLSRTHHKHTPDMIVCENSKQIPCELKSPKEFYDVGRFSRSHICSYFLQIIYGQCFSYSDLFRYNDGLSIYLVIPKVVTSDIKGFDNIEPYFQKVLNADWPLFRDLMGIEVVTFSVPNFACVIEGQNYGRICAGVEMLATKITYKCRTSCCS